MHQSRMRAGRHGGGRGEADPPSQVVVDAIAEHDPDRILVVLRSGEAATWLEDGQADRIPDEIAGVPVTIVEL